MLLSKHLATRVKLEKSNI